jgi:hypothetical protein
MSDPSADKLTIHGCRDDGLNTARVPAAQAQFWTLYATLPDGRVMAIADFKTAAQAHRARTLLLNAFAEPRRYVVAFESDSEGWTTSYDEDGRPHTYATREEAQASADEHRNDWEQENPDRDPEDGPLYEDFVCTLDEYNERHLTI